MADQDLTVKFLHEVAMVEVNNDPKNKNKGLIPRFHQSICDKFYGATGESLARACQGLAEEGILFKAFIKFNPSASDELSEENEMGIKTVIKGPHRNMKVGRDGRLNTPIYWFTDDKNIPQWAKNQGNKIENFRAGEDWKNRNGKHAEAEVPM